MKKSTSKKWFLFLLCWTTYVITYLCRVNFSSVLDKLSAGIGVSAARMGLIGSCFFFTYALGQIINGRLGDRISPFSFILFAITATGILNLAMTRTDSYPILLLIWGCNGYVQSMLWGPMMRILSERFLPEERMKISTGMSTSMVVGFIISWAIFGKGFLKLGWHFYFMVPAFLALIIAGFWVLPSREAHRLSRRAQSDSKSAKDAQAAAARPLRNVFFAEKIWLIALTCFCLGAVKESVSLWAPLLMTRMLHMDLNTSFLLISIIPFANFCGILLSNYLIAGSGGNVKGSLLILFGTAAICAILLRFLYEANAAVSVFLIAAVSGMMYGSNTILLSYVPISFSAYRLVSTLVGVFDFMSYMGAAAASACLGAIVSTGNYYHIFNFWLLAIACAVWFITHFNLHLQGTVVRREEKEWKKA